MQDRLYHRMCSEINLAVAFEQIETGTNVPYKNYYRDLLLAYTLAQSDNIACLSQRLAGYSYQPMDVVKINVPLSSGLQRPFTLLHLDDLIVYQAMVNVIAQKLRHRRAPFENKQVFSHILSHESSGTQFFHEHWRTGYRRYLASIKSQFQSGNGWIAEFDLASFYSTIDHYYLIRQLFHNAYSDITSLLSTCLQKWTNNSAHKLSHGLPQGPISSAILAEYYLLPLDQHLVKNGVIFVRYVDDIRIFGRSRDEVLGGAIMLENECIERGLVPHSGKRRVFHAHSIQEAIGRHPSFGELEKEAISSDSNEALTQFCSALKDVPTDISRARYILRTSPAHAEILRLVIDTYVDYPDLCDEYCNYIIRSTVDPNELRRLTDLVLDSSFPYEYAEGKLWETLARLKIDASCVRKLVSVATGKLRRSKTPALRIGLHAFLCSHGTASSLRLVEFERHSMVQALAVRHIPVENLATVPFSRLITVSMKRTGYEPALLCISRYIFGLREDLLTGIHGPVHDQSGVISNTLGYTRDIDAIGEILNKRYHIDYFEKWKSVFGLEYGHANQVLYLSEQVFHLERNAWMNYMATFVDIVVRRWLGLLPLWQPAVQWPRPIANNGETVDVGRLVASGGQLDMHFPAICDGFRKLNQRRNSAPSSHAYRKKDAAQTTSVGRQEQSDFVQRLVASFSQLLVEVRKWM